MRRTSNLEVVDEVEFQSQVENLGHDTLNEADGSSSNVPAGHCPGLFSFFYGLENSGEAGEVDSE